MKHSYSFSLILLPLVMMVALGVTLFIQRTGITYEVSSEYYQDLQFLPDEIVEVKNFFPDKPVATLVIYDSRNTEKNFLILLENVYATLDIMQVKYELYDVSTPRQLNLANYQAVVIATLDIARMDTQAFSIMNWVEDGGRVLFAIRPDPSSTFNLISGDLGIVDGADEMASAKGVEFVTDLFPGAKGMAIGVDFINSVGFAAQLKPGCVIHLASVSPSDMPLLWDCDLGNGKIVFVNSDQFGDKAARGVFAAAYSSMFDIFIYPVINTSVMYIDDFPAPLPEGSSEYITRFYDMDTPTFFKDVWWADMQELAEKYNVRYTGGMIETYTQQVAPPLDKQLEQETHKLLGRTLLAEGGEIVFHGHNHVPFCTDDYDVNAAYGYPAWPDTESAQLSLVEVYNFGKSVFPDYSFQGYIPPSNVLCSDSRRWLPMVVPDLKYIASLYLASEDALEYSQEFSEASDGIIEFPRVAAGYNLYDDEFMLWSIINELNLHYVNSHFIHPDDILDPERGADKGWAELKSQYEDYLKWIHDSVPGLRNMTGREGAMAVQRFSRLAVESSMEDGKLVISLGNFYDEAWLMMYSIDQPVSVDGGTFIRVSSDKYLIQATSSEVVVSFEE